MNDDLLKMLGFISTLPKEMQESISECKETMISLIGSYDEGVGQLALALIAAELAEKQ